MKSRFIGLLTALSLTSLAARAGSHSVTGPGIRQRNIALLQGEKYTFSLYARGRGSVVATFYEGNTPAFGKTFTDLTAQWQKLAVEFTVPRTVDALLWLEYCLGDTTTEYGKRRAANGHPAAYQLKTIEIDNEPWLMMQYPAYLDIVNKFCPAIRAQYPNLQLSVAGSYGYDTGPGEGNQAANRNGDPRLLEQAGKLFDILSPHDYNGIYFTADHVEDPYQYEQFLKGRGEIIKKSANPNIKVVSATATVESRTVKFTMPPLSAGIVRVASRYPEAHWVIGSKE